MSTLPIGCRCGLVRGELRDVTLRRGTRCVCYCDDCQAFARFLGGEGLIDAHGGTELFQTAPAHLRLSQGSDQLRAMKLSPKGMIRFYTACCRTPVGNLLQSPSAPFVGIPSPLFAHGGDARAVDAALGPILGRYQTKFASPPGRDDALPPFLLRVLTWLLPAFVRRQHRPSPFYDAHTGALVSEPQVLTRAERDALRP